VSASTSKPGSTRRFRGQSMVEFALVAPLFFMLLFGAIEGGRLIWTNHELVNATREGARLAMVGGSEAQVQATNAAVTQRILDRSAGLRPGQLTVTTTNLGGAPGTTVVVQSTYQFQPIVAMVFGAGSITLTARSAVIIQH
jgi:Flp pilus assembly protein TadG